MKMQEEFHENMPGHSQSAGRSAGKSAGTLYSGDAAGREYETWETDLLCESAPAWDGAFVWRGKRQGEFTVEDYFALPEDKRYELIDGRLFEMLAPSRAHQALVIKLAAFFENTIEKNGGPCEVYPAPFDIRLDRDDRTMVQPDVVVVCRQDLFDRHGVSGAPDLVIEILSPSTYKKDIQIKTLKYQAAGVREYWIVDPDRQLIAVYLFEQSSFPVYYTFDDRVPVGIWNGKAAVDFAEIRKKMAHILP